MSETVRVVDYFHIEVAERPGEGAKALAVLHGAGVNLRAFSGFPHGRRAQLVFVPEDARAFRAAARSAKWKVTGPRRGFLIQGDDRPGAAAALIGRLAAAGIGVVASQLICGAGAQYAGLLWVKPRDVRRAARVLGAA